MDNSDALELFLAAAASNLSRDCHAVVAGMYYKDSGREAINLAMSVVLSPESSLVGHIGPRIVDVLGLRAFRGTVSPEKVKPLLASIVEGRVVAELLPAGCSDALCLLDSRQEPSTLTAPSFRADLGDHGYPFPGHQSYIIGDQSMDKLLTIGRWNEITARLPAQDPPFSDFQMLCSHLGIDNRLEPGSSTSVYLISPVWLTLEAVTERPKDSAVEVKVWSAWSDLRGEASISLVPHSLRHTHLKRVEDISAWTTVADPESGTELRSGRLTLAPSVGPCDLFLNYGGRQVGSYRTGLASARLVAHELIDSDFEQLLIRLAGGKQKQDDLFEQGVAWLLHLCGFSVAHYGFKDMQSATDVVAFLGDAYAVYAECSLKPPDADKLKKVSSRAEMLRSVLEDKHGQRITLVRAYFCPRPRSHFAEDEVEHMSKEHVVLVANEDIEELVARARRGEPALETFFHLGMIGNRMASSHVSLRIKQRPSVAAYPSLNSRYNVVIAGTRRCSQTASTRSRVGARSRSLACASVNRRASEVVGSRNARATCLQVRPQARWSASAT